MKKLLIVLLSLALLLSCCGASAEQAPRKLESPADADEFVAAFFGEHPEEMDGAWALSAQMEAALVAYGGISGLAAQFAPLGVPLKVDPAYEGEIQGFRAFFVPCVFSATSADLVLVVQDGAIAGLSTGAYSDGKEETPAESDLFDSISLALPVPSLGELPGILTVPKGEGPFPVVVLIHGSGTSDKDETIGSLKPFRDIAEGLAAQGVAVYRFDKRSYTFGLRLASDKQFTLENESIEDAVNAVQLLAGQERIDPDRIFVLGHSLGGNAIPQIARELASAPVSACGYIMLAASPRPLDVLIREQYNYLLSLLPEVTAEQQAEADAVFADLDKLEDLDSLSEDDTVMNVYSPYWKWLAAYDIMQAAEEIAKPVLLLQGEEDYQVTMVDFGIWQDAFAQKENWTLKSYPGLTHPFVPGLKTEASAVYSGEGKVDEQVILDIASFVLSN